MEPTAWIVYQADWSGIEIYFDELAAYKAAVQAHAEVVQVGAGDVREQAKTPRKFDQPTNQAKENINGGQPKRGQALSPIVDDDFNPGQPAVPTGGESPRPKENGGEVIDQDAALKEAQRQAAARSRATDGEGSSFIR